VLQASRVCVNIIMDWEATVLPNVLGSTVATQPNYLNLGWLLWNFFVSFC
jgi:hypothetical protein